MILWTIAIVLTVIFLALLLLTLLRKVQFDAIHQNFLDIEDALGGQVIRNGFAMRPRFAGQFGKSDYSISITTEGGKKKEDRKYYICVSFQADSPISFSVMSANWLGDKADGQDDERFIVPIMDKQYMLETANQQRMDQLNLKKVEKVIRQLEPFAYILVGPKRILLERISENVIQDTKIEHLQPLLEGIDAVTKMVKSVK